MLSSFINSITTNLLITEYFNGTNMNVTTAYCWTSFEWAGSIDLCWRTIHAISLRKHRVCRTHMSILTGRVTSREWLLRQSPVLQFWCLRNYHKYNNEVPKPQVWLLERELLPYQYSLYCYKRLILTTVDVLFKMKVFAANKGFCRYTSIKNSLRFLDRSLSTSSRENLKYRARLKSAYICRPGYTHKL